MTYVRPLYAARAYVGDLPMTDDLEVILKYCGSSSYDLRSRSHLQVLWGIFLGLDPGLPLEVVLEPPLANLRLPRGLCGRSRAALVASPGGLGHSWEPMCGQERPKSSQERPKSAPQSGQQCPAKEWPRAPQKRFKSGQDGPRAAEEETEELEDVTLSKKTGCSENCVFLECKRTSGGDGAYVGGLGPLLGPMLTVLGGGLGPLLGPMWAVLERLGA